MVREQNKGADGDDERHRKNGLPYRLPILASAASLLLAFITWRTTASFSLYLDTFADWVFLFIGAVSVLWLVEQSYLAVKTRSRPASLWISAVLSAVLVLLLFESAQPPTKGLGAVVCDFGNVGFGYGKGPVWIKAATTTDGYYRLVVHWGGKKKDHVYHLDNDRYFTLSEDSFFATEKTSATITPPLGLSCGHGSPPSDATSVALVGWQSAPPADQAKR